MVAIVKEMLLGIGLCVEIIWNKDEGNSNWGDCCE